MRLLALTSTVGVIVSLMVAGCVQPTVEPEKPVPVEPTMSPHFPDGYEDWAQLNETPIVREEEGESRTLFANAVAAGVMTTQFQPGAILVKVQRRLVIDGTGATTVGELYKISVMEKEASGPNNGWAFRAFDPETKQELGGESEACVVCHSQRLDADYTFRALEVLNP